MIALRFRFITGRWHATAWGSHVNEGVPDWPPAPWRIYRALIATWFHKHRALVDETSVRSLVDALAAAVPSYALPTATSAHTRHYMPVNAGNKEQRTKIFDTFVHVAPGEYLTVLWPVELNPAQRELLAALLGSLNYLGRAESLVEALLLPPNTELPIPNAHPITEATPLVAEEEPIRLLASMTVQDYKEWTDAQTKETAKAKTGKKAKQNALPPSLFDALLADTGDLKAAGWSQPPGSRWIDYARPSEAFRIAPARQPRPSDRRPTVARFAIVSDVPPSITQALSLGERFHRALVSISEKISDNSGNAGIPAQVFTGCDADGIPLTGHSHTYYLSEADPLRGTVKYLTLFARMGFDSEAQRALEQLRKTWGYDGHNLQLILLGTGAPENFVESKAEQSRSLPLSSATIWESHTPFVPTRHLKTRKNGEPKLDECGLAIGSPEHELRRLLREESELRQRLGESGFPEPLKIEPITTLPIGGRRIRWLEFQRTRKHGDGRHAAGNSGYGFRITFPSEVTGPIALGYGAHFGLGLFVPEE